MVGHLLAVLPWDVTQHLCLATGGMQDAGQHLDGRGLPRANGTDEPQQLTRLHLESEPAHCLDRAVLGPDQSPQRAAHPGSFALGEECFLKIPYFDCGHLNILHRFISEMSGNLDRIKIIL